MKKLLMFLAVLMMATTLFAANEYPVKDSGVVATSLPKTVSIEYTINPRTSADSFTIGFSKVAVNDFTALSENNKASESNAMVVNPGEFYGTLTGIYVFWQIATQNPISITLKAEAMKDETTPNPNYIDVTLSSAVTGTNSNSASDGDAITTALTTESEPEEGESKLDVSQKILTYNTSKFTSAQCAGSQLITITTENLFGKTAGNYSGNLTATITSGN